jgi:hypothetical protein
MEDGVLASSPSFIRIGENMETNEFVALSIVALAAFLALRHFLGKKGGGCCGSDCLPKFEKKEKVPGPESEEKK